MLNYTKLILQYQLIAIFHEIFSFTHTHTQTHLTSDVRFTKSLIFIILQHQTKKHFFTWLFPHFGDRELNLVGGCLHHAPHTGLVGQTDGGTGGVFKHRDKTLGQDGLAVTQFCPDLDLHFLKNPSHTKYFILWNTNRFINILYAKFTCRSNLKIIKLCPTQSNMQSSVWQASFMPTSSCNRTDLGLGSTCNVDTSTPWQVLNDLVHGGTRTDTHCHSVSVIEINQFISFDRYTFTIK